ncbi:hypothetical protein HMPREF1214_02395 [Bacteroides sp. HPS0048]|jgi:hypothetical protein|uniref:hypothetical protein n=1 Tax=Bacteroides sp. HPS0048 TaxID=1078089 RepID=UPI00036C5BA3|nr:hypothetical protein [Bacteroides sp. HPS0048]EOA57874.1 hypothetical protein HMPREF1214_02395 [Bacteroides sp. HPS0048]
MFLSKDAEILINALRGEDNDTTAFKAAICDAVSIIMIMHQVHASEKEKKLLLDAIDTLVNYNELITALSKEK